MICDESNVNWNEVKAEYISNSKSSYRGLSEKYGISKRTLSERAHREKWPEAKKREQDKIVTAVVNKQSRSQVERLTRLTTVTDKLLDKIEQTINELDTAGIVMDKATLRQISGALKDIKDIQGIKSERDAREQEARIRSLEAAHEDKTPKEVKISFEGGYAEWLK